MRIALTGLPRVGKDTVGECLINTNKFHRLAFGDYLKARFEELFPEYKRNPKPRKELILFGQTCVAIDNQTFIRPIDSIVSVAHPNTNIVITDLRQPHEEKWCRENGFTIVRITSEKAEERIKALGEKVQTDIDSSKIKADYEISNDGTLEDLHSQIDNLLDCLNESEMKHRRL